MTVQEHELLVELSGDVDLSSAGRLLQMEKELRDRENIVFDVAGLEHVDSTFLRFLVNLKDHAARAQTATVQLVGVTPRLRRILEITGLARSFLS